MTYTWFYPFSHALNGDKYHKKQNFAPIIAISSRNIKSQKKRVTVFSWFYSQSQCCCCVLNIYYCLFITKEAKKIVASNRTGHSHSYISDGSGVLDGDWNKCVTRIGWMMAIRKKDGYIQDYCSSKYCPNYQNSYMSLRYSVDVYRKRIFTIIHKWQRELLPWA